MMRGVIPTSWNNFKSELTHIIKRRGRNFRVELESKIPVEAGRRVKIAGRGKNGSRKGVPVSGSHRDK